MRSISARRTHRFVVLGTLLPLLLLGLTAAPASAAPVAWWRFDDGPDPDPGTDNLTAVNSASPYDGALQNMDDAAWSTDTPSGTGHSLHFDGGDDFVNVPDHEAVDIGTSDFAVSLWIKRDRTGPLEGLFDHEPAAGYQMLMLDSAQGDAVRIRLDDGQDHVLIDSDDAITNDGQWHHIAFSANRDTNVVANGGQLFIDGVAQTAKNISAIDSLSASQDFWIGKFNSIYFQGSIDELQVYEQAMPRSIALFLRDNPDRASIVQPIAPEIWHNHDAAEPGDDPANTWVTTTDKTGRPMTWDSSTAPTYVSDTAFDQTTHQPGIAAAYEFDGTAVAEFGTLASIQRDPATFEVWFRPSDTAGQEILLELGGGTGTSFSLDDDDLRLVSHDTGETVNLVATDYLATRGIDDFIQVVGVFDFDADRTSFYVDGQLVGFENLVPDRWTGTDPNGLGGINSKVGGEGGFNFNPYGNFEGEIGIYRFYQRALSPGEVAQNYLAVSVPEPSTLSYFLFFGLTALASFRRRKR
jgi:hypothetical protein